MRTYGRLLVLFGLAGLVLGVVTMFRNAANPMLPPFWLENHGGPGPILGAILLIFGGLYLASRSASEG
jgi:hypothetical protein